MWKRKSNFVCFLNSESFTYGSTGPKSVYITGLEPHGEGNLSLRTGGTQLADTVTLTTVAEAKHLSLCINTEESGNSNLQSAAYPLQNLCWEHWILPFHFTWASGGHTHVLLREETFLNEVTWMSPSWGCFGHGSTWILYNKLS